MFLVTHKINTWITLSSAQSNFDTIISAPIIKHRYRTLCPNNHLQCSPLTLILIYQGSLPSPLCLFPLFIFITSLITILITVDGAVPLGTHELLSRWIIIDIEQIIDHQVLYKLEGSALISKMASTSSRNLANSVQISVRSVLGVGRARTSCLKALRCLWTVWIYCSAYLTTLFMMCFAASIMDLYIQNFIWWSRVAIWSSKFWTRYRITSVVDGSMGQNALGTQLDAYEKEDKVVSACFRASESSP